MPLCLGFGQLRCLRTGTRSRDIVAKWSRRTRWSERDGAIDGAQHSGRSRLVDSPAGIAWSANNGMDTVTSS